MLLMNARRIEILPQSTSFSFKICFLLHCKIWSMSLQFIQRQIRARKIFYNLYLDHLNRLVHLSLSIYYSSLFSPLLVKIFFLSALGSGSSFRILGSFSFEVRGGVGPLDS